MRKIAIIDPYHQGIGPGVHWADCHYVRTNLADPNSNGVLIATREKMPIELPHEPCANHGG
jgi:hypothetical protein